MSNRKNEIELAFYLMIFFTMMLVASVISVLVTFYIIKFRKPILEGNFAQVSTKAALISLCCTVAIFFSSWLYMSMLSSDYYNSVATGYRNGGDYIVSILWNSAIPFFLEVFLLLIIANIVDWSKVDKSESERAYISLCSMGVTVLAFFMLNVTGVFTHSFPSYSDIGLDGNIFNLFQFIEVVLIAIVLVISFIGGEEAMEKYDKFVDMFFGAAARRVQV